MGIENLAEDLLNEPDDEKEKEPEAPGRIEDNIFSGIQRLYGEIRQLKQNVVNSREAKLENLAEFQEELSAAKREFGSWGRLLKLAVEKRVLTAEEVAVLAEGRLDALARATKAAKGAGVENLESVEAELRAVEKAIEDYEPLDATRAQSSAFRAEGMALREKQRLLKEAQFWFKKAAIIQLLMEMKAVEEPEGVSASKREVESLEQFIADMQYFEMTKPENDLEWRVLGDLRWQQGVAWGKPRSGHPEGKIIFHIVEVLQNIEKPQDVSEHERAQLRLIAFIHDSFKQRVDKSKPRVGENHHGMIARRFAEKYTQDEGVLKIIQLHDEAYNAWRQGDKYGDWKKAEKRLRDLIEHLGKENLQLYLLFYQCDNETGTKDQECVRWFKERIKEL